MRSVFISVYTRQPCRVGEIQNDIIVVRNTIYYYLKILEKLGLIRRISIMEIQAKNDLDYDEKMVKKKADEWLGTMDKKNKNYYTGRTSFNVTTKLAEDFIKFICKLEGIPYDEKNSK